LKINGVHHVGVTVTNLEKSLAYYHGVLGLELLRRGNDLQSDFIRTLVGVPEARLSNAMLGTPGGGMLELIEYHHPVGRHIHAQPNDAASTHFCLSIADLGDAYGELREKGIRFHSEPQRCPSGPMEGYTFAYSRDPDGAIVEFLEAPSEVSTTTTPGKRGDGQ